MRRKAVFPGTFDPFTIGHHSLVKRSLELVDEIVIAIGVNDAKKSYFPLEKRIAMAIFPCLLCPFLLTIYLLINSNENRYHLFIKIAVFCYCFIF